MYRKFYNSRHPDPNDPDVAKEMDEQFPDGMFRFEKKIQSKTQVTTGICTVLNKRK